MKEKARLETKLCLETLMAQVSRGKDLTKEKQEVSEDWRWRDSEWGARFQLSESNISGGKNWGVGNINQSVHLVGNHMADQHANSANLLIFSNGVQLIPLAAFISLSHTRGRGVERKKREQGRFCYDSTLPPQLFLPFSRSRGIKPRWWMRWTHGPQVAPVATVGGVEKLEGVREVETVVTRVAYSKIWPKYL